MFGRLNPRVPKIWRVLSESERRKIASTEFIALIPKTEKTDRDYLYYLLGSNYVLPRSQELVSGSTPSRQRTDIRSFLRIPVPLPPLPEQRRIAGALRTIQEAIAAQEDVIAAARELKRSLMERLFTYGPGAEPALTKDTEIGEIPRHWGLTTVGKVLSEDLRNGRSARATESPDGVRTLTLTAVTENEFSLENTKLTSADPTRVRDLWLKPGDILVERANTPEYVGLAALYEGPEDFAIYPDLMIRVRVKEQSIIPRFLAEFLVTNRGRQYFRQNARGTAGSMSKISQDVVRDALVPLPPKPEQHTIASAFFTIDRKITAEEQRKAALEEVFRSALEQLMTGQIRLKAKTQIEQTA
jgi:type I restriction enzyme S subunit